MYRGRAIHGAGVPARPHARGKSTEGWDTVHQLREDIKTLETELDQVLRSLEPD